MAATMMMITVATIASSRPENPRIVSARRDGTPFTLLHLQPVPAQGNGSIPAVRAIRSRSSRRLPRVRLGCGGPISTSPVKHDTQHDDRADEPEQGEREQDRLGDRPPSHVAHHERRRGGKPREAAKNVGRSATPGEGHLTTGDGDDIALPIEDFDFGPDPPTGVARRPRDGFRNLAPHHVVDDRRAVRQIDDEQTMGLVHIARA